jgi:hypothetical protein
MKRMKNEELRMKNDKRKSAVGDLFFILNSAFLIFLLALSASAQTKVFRYTVSSGATVFVTNDYGPITVRAASSNQVVVTATARSPQAVAECNQNGNRVDVRTRAPQDPAQARMDYDLQVPPDAMVTLHTATGPVRVQNLAGDLTVEADTGTVEVQGVGGGHVHVRTVSGPITLANVRKAHVELRSVGGDLKLDNVSGPQVSGTTTGGAIHYAGDFGGAGEYSLSSHSGDIDIAVPASASVDISASSITGSVENSLPLQPDPHPAVPIAQGKSFSGHANSGASSVRLRTFSGRIRVTKQ